MALPPLEYPLINGVRHSFSSILYKMKGTEFQGFTEITFGRKRSRSMGYGNHPDPMFKSRGKNEYTAKAKLYLAEFNYFTEEVLGGPGYGDIFFPLFVSYSENGLPLITYEIQGCTLDEENLSNTEGTDLTMVELDFGPLKILKNGIDDVTTPLRRAG